MLLCGLFKYVLSRATLIVEVVGFMYVYLEKLVFERAVENNLEFRVP